jgi:SAM-dependent methyltransferase
MKTPEQWAAMCKQITAGFVGSTGKASTYGNGREFVQKAVKPLGLWKEGDRALEIGSGNGRVAMGLIGEGLEYHGVEVIAGSVEFCKRAFVGEGDFQFYHLDVQNERYNSGGRVAPAGMALPFQNGWFDVVIAMSLFSHLETIPVMLRYVAEAARVLKAGGRFLSTWYLSPPCPRISESAARTVYALDDAGTALERWFRIIETGGGGLWGDQEYIVCERLA